MQGRRLIAAGVCSAAALGSTVAGFAITGTAFGSEEGCRPMSPPVSRPVSPPVQNDQGQNGDDQGQNDQGQNGNDDRCQVSPPVSQPVGHHHHHHDNGDHHRDNDEQER